MHSSTLVHIGYIVWSQLYKYISKTNNRKVPKKFIYMIYLYGLFLKRQSYFYFNYMILFL